jgi:lyso-ornithine lipid O-acyltransferase
MTRVRASLRLLRLGWVILSGMVALGWFLLRGRDERSARIAWMQWMSRRFLSLLHCRVELSGTVPERGLMAANHLGYVDILVLGSVCPAVFVAKSDVDSWPVFGWLARNAGTIFVSRDQPAQVPSQLRKMEEPLAQGHPVILFPEGTSSDGNRVLPFRSSLLESAVRSGLPVTPAALSYDLHGDGVAGDEVAYWGDHTLVPHLVNLLSKKAFTARLSIGKTRCCEADRKKEAARLHGEVAGLLRCAIDP